MKRACIRVTAIWIFCVLAVIWWSYFPTPQSLRNDSSNNAAAAGDISDLQFNKIMPGSSQCGGEDGLMKWALLNGARAPKLKFGEFPYKDNDTSSEILYRRGLMATEDISSGETMISVPNYLGINANTAAKSRIGDVFQELLNNEGWTKFQVLVLFLLWEKENPPSIYFHYLCVLPTSFTTSVFWDDDKLNQVAVKNPAIKKWTLDQRKAWENYYHSHYPALFERFPKHFNAKVYTLDLFLWGSSVVLSRNWAVGKLNLLVPFADMINHKLHGGHFSQNSERIRLVADMDYKKGEEVFISYGGHCNAHYLLYYGFSLDDNLETCEA